MRDRWIQALPRRRQVFIGAPLWGLLMALSAVTTLYFRHWFEADGFWRITVLFFAGGTLAWTPALMLARSFASGKPAPTRFSACFLFLGLTTFAVTALLFALEYRMFYAQWHAPALSRMWLFQQAFTAAGAGYQFAVLGMRLYFPVGLLCLVFTSFALARRMR